MKLSNANLMRTSYLIPCFIVLLNMLCSGCKKEHAEISSIEILSAKRVALCEFEVVITSEIHNAGLKPELAFEDLTETSPDDIVFEPVLMKNYRQTDTLRYIINRVNHNFRVKARLMQDDMPVSESEAVITTDPVSYTVTVFADALFGDPAKNIAVKLSNNQHFMLMVDFNISYHVDTIEVKLNRSIPLAHNLNPVDFGNNGTSDMHRVYAFAYLNDQIDPGIYDVFVYIDGVEFRADAGIEVLEDHWTMINQDFPGDEKYQYATFTDGDNLYLTGGRYSAFYDMIPRVWRYNFTMDEWTRLNDFPARDVEVRQANLEYQGIWYTAIQDNLKNDSTVLWKYNMAGDSWQHITTYPGSGGDITCFMAQGRFFAGGGRRRINENVPDYKDFWTYDLGSGIWSKCKDLPLASSYPYTISCASGNLAYIYCFDNTFWSFDPAIDEWTLESKFPGPERYLSNLACLDNKVYLIGAEAGNNQRLTDCWEYDTEGNNWKLNSFLPAGFITGFAAPFHNSLLTGLGYSGLDKSLIYLMTP
jgi:hypothetical protein